MTASSEALADLLVSRRSDLSARLMTSIRTSMTSRSVHGTRYDLARGERLHPAGHADGRVYFVQSGAISMEHFASTGRRTILDVLPRNDYFGEDALPGLANHYTPTALTPTVVVGLEFELFQNIVREADVHHQWRASLMLRSHRYRSFLLQHATSDCEARLAMRLYDLSHAFGTNVDTPSGRAIRIDLRLRHEDFAAMVATTRSRVGFFLQRFADRKMLRKADDGRLVVDPLTLVSYIMERMALTVAQ